MVSNILPVGTGFSEQFPGIIPHLLTLSSNFRVPFYREVILALGICSVSKQSCSNILKGGPGQAITIVVGGAAESLSARPGTADLTLRKRYAKEDICSWHDVKGVNMVSQAGIHQACDPAWVGLVVHSKVKTWYS